MNTVKHIGVNRAVGQHHGDLRRALIDAALELIADSDVDAVTLRAVARRARVSAGAPYHHFEDKNALLAAVALDGFDALGRRQVEIADRETTGSARLERLAAEYVLFAWEHESHYRLMFRTLLLELPGAEAAALDQAARAAFSRLAEAITAANPALGQPESFQRALLAWSLAHGAVDVGRWGAGLTADLDRSALAADVGRAVRRLALEPPESDGQ
nr:TetR/AcrR family transcriptional regulator [Mycolicibacterium hippocampi]